MHQVDISISNFSDVREEDRNMNKTYCLPTYCTR